MTTIIVRAKKDGRGGIHPFGTYGKHQAGASVQIGEKKYKVNPDGRIFIPKSVMDRGIKGKDGRMRIAITFSIQKGIDGWKSVQTITSKPLKIDKDTKTSKRVYDKKEKKFVTIYSRPKKHRLKNRDEIKPKDEGDYSWSP